jgi:hypothetical protein
MTSYDGGRIYDAMTSFFTTDEWNFDRIPDRPVLRMGFNGDDGQWMCFAQAREEQQQFIYYSVAPVKAPEERRAEMAEFITRANYGMILGNFELDFSDGEIRYKTSIDVEGSELTPALIKQLVYANVLTMDRYLKGIMAVAFGGTSAIQAIQNVES